MLYQDDFLMFYDPVLMHREDTQWHMPRDKAVEDVG